MKNQVFAVGADSYQKHILKILFLSPQMRTVSPFLLTFSIQTVKNNHSFFGRKIQVVLKLWVCLQILPVKVAF